MEIEKDTIYYDNKLTAVQELKDLNLATANLVEFFKENGEFLGKKGDKYNFSDIYKKAEKIKNNKSNVDKFIEEVDNFIKAYDELVMINPNKDKFKDTTLKLHYYELFRMFSNNIDKENSVLFVFGFSFADEHICEIVNRAVKSNPTLLVVIFVYSEDDEKTISDRVKGPNVVFASRENKKKFDLETINENFFKKTAEKLKKPKNTKEDSYASEKTEIKENSNTKTGGEDGK